MVSWLRVTAALSAATTLLLAGCGAFPMRDGGPRTSMDVSRTPDPIPRWEPRSAYGNKSYQISGQTYEVLAESSGYSERGLASWYGSKFDGHYTSSREIYNMYGMTAAHRTLPLPTYVQVTNLQNGRSCVVRVNDRGPFHSDRIIDLSYAAASKLGIVESGTAMVEVRAIDPVESPDTPRVAAAVATPQPGFRTDDEAPRLLPAVNVPPAATAAPAPVPTSAPVAAATPVPPPAAPVAAGAALYVQVGAFASRDNAERLRARLVDQEKLKARVHESVNEAKRVLYLVRVGPVENKSEAERLATRLQGLGVGAPRVISD